MTISDIEYFIADKQYNSAMRALNEATYTTPQQSPLDTAKEHYKSLGWFK
jgi:hypothetical protein